LQLAKAEAAEKFRIEGRSVTGTGRALVAVERPSRTIQ
jgi:hypothetical protein